MKSPTRLYHWTHRSNVRSIRRVGLSPDWCQGRKKCVWACTRAHIGWALTHVAARHGHNPDEYVLLEVKPYPSRIRRSAFRGVFTCGEGYSPSRIVSIRRGLLANPQPLTPQGE